MPITQPSRRDLASAIRFLAADAVETSKSGHASGHGRYR